jgi:hypothetical protein
VAVISTCSIGAYYAFEAPSPFILFAQYEQILKQLFDRLIVDPSVT